MSQDNTNNILYPTDGVMNSIYFEYSPKDISDDSYYKAIIKSDIYRKSKNYDLLINIKYNQSPTIKNKGSAIFLHLTNKNYNPTSGCVALLKTDFLKILPFIDKKTKIIIS